MWTRLTVSLDLLHWPTAIRGSPAAPECMVTRSDVSEMRCEKGVLSSVTDPVSRRAHDYFLVRLRSFILRGNCRC